MSIQVKSKLIKSRDVELASIWAINEKSTKEHFIIFLHGGPNGSKDGPGSSMLFKILQEMFLKSDIESVRFDFMGEGESSGDYINTTLSSQIEDFQAILNEVRCLGYKNISIIAESFGVSCVLGTNPNQFSNLVLLWGAVYFFDEGLCFAPWYSDACKTEISKNGFFKEGSQKIGKGLLDEIEKVNNLENSFSKIDIPTLIIHGSLDSEVPLSYNCFKLYKNMKDNCKAIIYPGLDHFLQIPNSNGEVKHEMLYDEIIDWLKSKLND